MIPPLWLSPRGGNNFSFPSPDFNRGAASLFLYFSYFMSFKNLVKNLVVCKWKTFIKFKDWMNYCWADSSFYTRCQPCSNPKYKSVLFLFIILYFYNQYYHKQILITSSQLFPYLFIYFTHYFHISRFPII